MEDISDVMSRAMYNALDKYEVVSGNTISSLFVPVDSNLSITFSTNFSMNRSDNILLPSIFNLQEFILNGKRMYAHLSPQSELVEYINHHYKIGSNGGKTKFDYDSDIERCASITFGRVLFLMTIEEKLQIGDSMFRSFFGVRGFDLVYMGDGLLPGSFRIFSISHYKWDDDHPLLLFCSPKGIVDEKGSRDDLMQLYMSKHCIFK